MATIDINCDLGESFGSFRVGHDAEVMPFITSANIACGFHAGDPSTMADTVKLARRNGVAVGAHPGFPDLRGFGRRYMSLTPEEISSTIVYQVGALQAFARITGVDLQHVKPHGALYNAAAKDRTTAHAITDAVKALNQQLILFAPANSVTASIGVKAGLRVAREVFADRAYNRDGSLVSRRLKGAVIRDAKEVAERAVQMVTEGEVKAENGHTVHFDDVHTICVHGDTPNAVELARSIKEALLKADVKVAPVGTFL